MFLVPEPETDLQLFKVVVESLFLLILRIDFSVVH